MEEIRHKNIIYLTDISELGGVETYVYELAKKFKDYDIAIVYKSAHPSQIKRLSQYCYTYKHTGQKIICDVAIINYDSSIIDYITKDIWSDRLTPGDTRGIYQTVHADYTNPAYKIIPQDKRVKTYLCITKYILETYSKLIGATNCELCYNPLTIEEESKPLILLSATRLSPVKGKDRMIKLAHALDAKKINYIWYVFTNDKNAIDSPNVVYMNPRFDISRWMQQADYVVQLSDTEACSYTINEALYRNIPIIVTPLPYLNEIGYRDNKTGYTLDFDCSNIDDVVDKILTKPVFKFKHLKDNYSNILLKSKSRYYEEVLRPVTVKVIITQGYTDLMVGHHVDYGEIIENVPIGRARGLVTSNLVEIIEGENNDGNN